MKDKKVFGIIVAGSAIFTGIFSLLTVNTSHVVSIFIFLGLIVLSSLLIWVTEKQIKHIATIKDGDDVTFDGYEGKVVDIDANRYEAKVEIMVSRIKLTKIKK